jgi:hypothetical protein
MRLPWMSRHDRRAWKSATTLIDPVYGRNDLLWPLLDLITSRLAATH